MGEMAQEFVRRASNGGAAGCGPLGAPSVPGTTMRRTGTMILEQESDVNPRQGR